MVGFGPFSKIFNRNRPIRTRCGAQTNFRYCLRQRLAEVVTGGTEEGDGTNSALLDENETI